MHEAVHAPWPVFYFMRDGLILFADSRIEPNNTSNAADIFNKVATININNKRAMR